MKIKIEESGEEINFSDHRLFEIASIEIKNQCQYDDCYLAEEYCSKYLNTLKAALSSIRAEYDFIYGLSQQYVTNRSKYLKRKAGCK